MISLTQTVATDKTLQQSSNVLKQIANTVFGGHSLPILLLSLVAATVFSKITSTVLRNLSRGFGKRADASTDQGTVTRYRRLETWTILAIALVRILIFIFALYFWWTYTHPGNRTGGALVGASALLALIMSGVFSPLLRDFAFGGSMMAEHWFGVGDLITIPYPDVQGVVERITLRSTRIRGLNGEVVWVANQNISAVRVAKKGVWAMAIELFVTDPGKAEKLIDLTNDLLPTGPSLVVSPLRVMTAAKRGGKVWHVTAIIEVAPGREWLVERTAIDLLKQLDTKSKEPILITEPISRYADNDTERQFARAVKNAKKTHRTRRPKLTSTSTKTEDKTEV